MIAVVVTTGAENISYDQAIRGPHKALWKSALQSELESMTSNGVSQLLPRSEAKGKSISDKWVLKVNDDSTRKARWVARGFSEPLDSNQSIFADVIHNVTVRLFFAMAAKNRLYILHANIKNGFLQCDNTSSSPLYMQQPKGA